VLSMLKVFACLQPIEFVAGGQVAGAAVKKITDTAGGLFAGASGPKPPPALSSAVLGMKTGGKVWNTVSAACSAPYRSMSTMMRGDLWSPRDNHE